VEHEWDGIRIAGHGDVQVSPVVKRDPSPFHVHGSAV